MQHRETNPSESDANRSPNRISKTDSHERTNERTNEESDTARRQTSVARHTRAYSESAAITLGELLAEGETDVEQLSHEDASRLSTLLHARNQRLSASRDGHSIAQVLDSWFDHLEQHAGKRWPVIRSGERAPIPSALRLSIYLRDGFTCRYANFGSHSDRLQLDHCIPWSAGGPDDSDNLRTICAWCNERRSNYIDVAHETVYRPTTWWCIECWSDSSKWRMPWKDGTNPNRVPHIGDPDGPVERVFCAHCKDYSFSPLYFVGGLGRRLLAAIAPPEPAKAAGPTEPEPTVVEVEPEGVTT